MAPALKSYSRLVALVIFARGPVNGFGRWYNGAILDATWCDLGVTPVMAMLRRRFVNYPDISL